MAQDRTDSGFERIPPARQSQTRRALAEICEQRNPPKAPLYHHGITVQIEHFSYSLDDICSYLGLVRRDANFELRRAGHCFYANNSGSARDVKHSLEGVCRDPFQPWNQMRLVESHNRLPIVG